MARKLLKLSIIMRRIMALIVDVKKFDFAKLVESRQAYISRIHTSYDNVLAKNNVDVIRGFAKFVNKKYP